MKESKYSANDLWSGGFFELLMVFKRGSIQDVTTALGALRDNENIVAFFTDARAIQVDDGIGADGPTVEAHRTLYGELTLPNGETVPFKVVNYQLDGQQFRYVSLLVPMSSLARLTSYEVGPYPFGSNLDYSWLAELSEFLYRISREVFTQVNFDSGGVGWFTSIEYEEIENLSAESVPRDRFSGYLLNRKGTLHWYPPNNLNGSFSIKR